MIIASLALVMLPGVFLAVILGRVIPCYGRCKPAVAATMLLTGPIILTAIILAA